MKKFLCFIFAIVLIFACVGCDYTVPETDVSNDNNSSQNITESKDETSEQTSSEETNESSVEETVYATDEVVNRFIKEFNAGSSFQMSDISKGNIRTKFFAYANNCYIEMINANDAGAECFSVTVNGGKENSERDRMFEVAADVIRTLDPSIPADKITQTIEYLKNEQYMVKDYKVTDNVIVETYVPIVELSYGKSDCRIDIISKNYK